MLFFVKWKFAKIEKKIFFSYNNSVYHMSEIFIILVLLLKKKIFFLSHV